ncbi:nucleotidyltransferase family protein [Polaribacter glomeratus]|uniref:Glycosyl transferase n=1 Tax=Polaribacter glomeratus TaxID=102 RepID=A0A2S7WFB3_9FLAO|nr:nucleotidyltransferase family protein [Polaribacter glomeratus]PQJ76318.1 glycosyl transferase [Polaribacter glomeratus]TXD65451.1 nucleotidyltransferase family protein [Polaribacter glomeratus]
MKNIAILVLAAGKSSRMDGIKQLEKINNKTLLDITLEKLKSIFSDKIYCVLGANADKIKAEITSKNIQFIENQNYEKGLSSSIVSGIEYFNKEALNFDGIYILLADQPGIEIVYLESLLLLFQEHKDTIIASNYGNKLGVPAIFPKKYFPELLLIRGDKGAKEFLKERKSEVISPELSTNFFDIDTKEDLELFKNS